MAVMTTGVCQPRTGRGIGDVFLILHGQSVHIRTNGDGPSSPLPVEGTHNPCPSHTGFDLQTKASLDDRPPFGRSEPPSCRVRDFDGDPFGSQSSRAEFFRLLQERGPSSFSHLKLIIYPSWSVYQTEETSVKAKILAGCQGLQSRCLFICNPSSLGIRFANKVFLLIMKIWVVLREE